MHRRLAGASARAVVNTHCEGAGVTAPRRVLPVIVLAQLAGTSPWFAVNAVMPDLQREFGWAAADVGTLTSSLQLGFIAGTLVFALLAIADRFSARRVFLLCSLASAVLHGGRRRCRCRRSARCWAGAH